MRQLPAGDRAIHADEPAALGDFVRQDAERPGGGDREQESHDDVAGEKGAGMFPRDSRFGRLPDRWLMHDGVLCSPHTSPCTMACGLSSPRQLRILPYRYEPQHQLQEVTMKRIILGVTAALTLVAGAAFAQGTYKKELPAALVKKARITEDVAAKAALARVPKGEIQTVELEEEKGKLIYSYDIKVPGKSGIDEVGVSAMTGKVVAYSHETPADEKKEAAADAKAAAKKKKP